MNYLNVVLQAVGKGHHAVVFLAVVCLTLTAFSAEALSPVLFALFLLVLGWGAIRAATGAGDLFPVKLFVLVYSASLVFTCAFYLYYVQIYGIPYESGGTDDQAFDTVAQILANSDFRTIDDVKDIVRSEGTGTWNASGYYTILVASVHYLVSQLGLEPHTLNPRMVNSFFLALTAVLTYWLARRFCRFEESARFAGYYLGLLPTVMFCATHVYRDVIVGFGIVAVTASTVLLIDRFQSRITLVNMGKFLKVSIIFVFCLSMAASFREGFKIIVPLMVGAMVLSQIRSKWLLATVCAACAAVLAVAFLHGFFGGFFDSAAFFTEYYTEYRSTQSSGSGIGSAIYRLPFLVSIPFRVIYAAINPLPFPTEVITENYRRVGTLIWFFNLPFLLIGLVASLKGERREGSCDSRPVGIAFISTFLLVALVTMQSRHITMFAPAGAILTVLGVEQATRPAATYFKCMALLSGFFVGMYFFYRFV